MDRINGLLSGVDELAKAVGTIGEQLSAMRSAAIDLRGEVIRRTECRPSHTSRIPTARPANTRRAESPQHAAPGTDLSKCDRALLTALAQHPDGLTKSQACTYAGYVPSGTTADSFARFTASGWMESNGGGLFLITGSGHAALGSFDPLPVGDALRERMVSEAGPCEASILEALFNVYPAPKSKAELCQAAGYVPSGTTADVFAKLTRLGWMVKERGGFRASEDLYAE
jgi:hypothetical protein